MKRMTECELREISGGMNVWGVVGIIAGIVFGIGTADGYFRPLKCNR